MYFDFFQPNVAFHIETSNLVCRVNKITGFYMKCNAGFLYGMQLHVSFVCFNESPLKVIETTWLERYG